MSFRASPQRASECVTRRSVLAALAAAGAMSTNAFADTARTVRLIVPSSAGSGTDATARALQTGWTKSTGSTVVVENMAGASGLVGLKALGRAQPTDPTFVVITNNVVTAPAVMKSFTFDALRDATPISMLVSIPMVLVVKASRVPVSNAKELAALLKSKPGQLSFGSAGAGSVIHLATELFLEEAGAKAEHIPFQGPNPMIVALLGGQIDFGTVAASIAVPHIQNGTLRAIGATTATRTAGIPDIPTFVEQGFPNCVADAWVVLLGPKGMDAASVKRVNATVADAMKQPEVQELLAKQGSVLNLTTPEQAGATIRSDLAKYAKLVKKIGLEPQ